MINEFRGKYYGFSNFGPGEVTVFGLHFKNGEAAFHSQKDVSRAKEFCNLNPSDSKKLGRVVNLRPDWEDVKEDIMYEVVKAKFEQNEDLKKLLLSTDDKVLIEGTTPWHDNYWGNCECRRCKDIPGLNRLGIILMKVRSELLCKK